MKTIIMLVVVTAISYGCSDMGSNAPFQQSSDKVQGTTPPDEHPVSNDGIEDNNDGVTDDYTIKTTYTVGTQLEDNNGYVPKWFSILEVRVVCDSRNGDNQYTENPRIYWQPDAAEQIIIYETNLGGRMPTLNGCFIEANILGADGRGLVALEGGQLSVVLKNHGQVVDQKQNVCLWSNGFDHTWGDGYYFTIDRSHATPGVLPACEE